MPKYNPADGPIPGQSLTHEPKANNWERPPQFARLEDATNYLFDMVTKPKNAEVLLTLMDKKIPLQAIAQVIIMTGFAEGKWSPDLGMLLVKPLIIILSGVAARTGRTDVRIKMANNQDIQTLAKLNTITFAGDKSPSSGMPYVSDPLSAMAGDSLMSPLNNILNSGPEPAPHSNPLLSPTANVPLGVGA